MNEERSFERFVADNVAGQAGGIPLPDDFYDDMHTYATTTRQRPRWLAFIKEPPMRSNSRVAVGSPTVRVIAVTIATLLLAVALVGAGIAGQRLLAADAAEIVVNHDGSGDYITINEAVAAAQDGDHILVRPGTYVEAVVVGKDVAIAGDGDEPVVLAAPEDGPRSEAQYLGPVPYALLLDDVTATVTGLTFSGQGSAVHVSGGTSVLTDLTFQGVGKTNTNADGVETGTRFPEAVALYDGAVVTLADSAFSGGGAIASHGNTRSIIEGNVLQNGPSIHVFLPAEGSIVRGNVVTQGSVRGIGAFGGPHQLLIEDNVVTDMDGDAITIGSDLADATDPLVRGNEIRGGFTGISVAEGSGPTITDNVVSGTELGIWTSNAAEQLTATGNALTDNDIGIRVLGGQGLFEENTVVGGATGIQLVWNADPSIIGNAVTGASDAGLSIDSGSTGSVTDNRLCDNPINLDVEPERENAIRAANEICEDD
jgi:parallel beta-helix repeat protein